MEKPKPSRRMNKNRQTCSIHTRYTKGCIDCAISARKYALSRPKKPKKLTKAEQRLKRRRERHRWRMENDDEYRVRKTEASFISSQKFHAKVGNEYWRKRNKTEKRRAYMRKYMVEYNAERTLFRKIMRELEYIIKLCEKPHRFNELTEIIKATA